MSSKRRRSERSRDAVRTKHLRRINELFWETDERYACKEEASAINSNSSISFGRLKLEQIHASPHIYTIDNFLTESELIYLESRIELAERHDYFKTSVVDLPTTALAANHVEKLRQQQQQHEFILPKPGDRVLVLWAVEESDTSENLPDNGDLAEKEFKPWGATVLSPSSSSNDHFSFTKDTPGVTAKDREHFRRFKNPVIFSLKYDLYQEAGYDQHTYCDVVFLSNRLLYDITSQGVCKYSLMQCEDSIIKDEDPLSLHSLLSSDEDEDAESKQQISFQTPQRTSSFIHFSKSHHTKISSIEMRASEILGVSSACIEPIQLVRYQIGDFFQAHHDLGTLYDDGSIELPPSSVLFPPRRLVTIFVYINTVPKEFGGATRFPLLMEQKGTLSVRNKDKHILQVQPKRGRALLFCNILRNGLPEPLTVHSGEPLTFPSSAVSSTSLRTRLRSTIKKDTVVCETKIIKYGINIWACER